jgi:hypothetical protein
MAIHWYCGQWSTVLELGDTAMASHWCFGQWSTVLERVSVPQSVLELASSKATVHHISVNLSEKLNPDQGECHRNKARFCLLGHEFADHTEA